MKIEVEIPDEKLICPSCAVMQERESEKPVEFPCFECEKPAKANHHVIPKSLGGTRTIPLCLECHSKVHQKDLVSMYTLAKNKLEEVRKRGGDMGGKPKPWQTRDEKTKELKECPEKLRKLRDINRLMTEGRTGKEISGLMGMSAPTISRHVKQLKDETSEMFKKVTENE